MGNWTDLSLHEQSRISALYFRSHSKFATEHDRLAALGAFEVAADQHGITTETLGRQCRQFLYYEKQFLGRGTLIDDTTVHPPNDDLNSQDPYSIRFRPAPGPLTDIRVVDPKTDQTLWLEWLHERFISNPYIVVKHPCDKHMPFHDLRADDLDVQLTALTQPDLIVVGSDGFDFPSIGKFDKDPDVREDFEDVLELVAYYWHWHISSLRKAAPNAIFVYIWGNHERRLIHWLGQNAPQVRKTVLRHFKEIIRAAGVWWLGEVDAVRVGPVKIEHGVNHGDNAAKTNLMKAGAQVCKWQGHGHRRQFYHMEGEDFSVASIMSGHLSKYDDNTRVPHYIRGASMKGQYHTLGTAIGDINLSSRDVEFINLAFQEDEHDELYTRFERKTIRSESRSVV